MEQLLDIFLNVDKHLAAFTTEHGAWPVYGLVFLIIFCETGLVVTPFLPGDSLLFAAGALAASPARPIDGWTMALVIFVGAVLGDAANYHIGKYLGPRVFRAEGLLKPGDPLWKRIVAIGFKRQHLDKANAFYAKHGGKAVILARFVPIVRTFIPFVAGAGAMHYSRFMVFNVAGAVLWIVICLGAGYLFGNIEIVRKNFELVVLGIIAVSLLPIVVEIIRARAAKPAAALVPPHQ